MHITTSPFIILSHVSDLLVFSIAFHRRDLHRDIFAERSDLTVEIFIAMATGWDGRGTQLDMTIDDSQKLWIGNLRKDLTESEFTEWLHGENVQLNRPVSLVRWGCKRAEEGISFTDGPYPHPTVTSTLACTFCL